MFGLSANLTHDEYHEQIELFGEHVIPEFDKNLEHSTSVYRRNAGGLKYPPFNGPVDENLKHSVLLGQRHPRPGRQAAGADGSRVRGRRASQAVRGHPELRVSADRGALRAGCEAA
ncbi:hypothetical protein ACU686_43090 [Yinghuangia aomiensis]